MVLYVFIFLIIKIADSKNVSIIAKTIAKLIAGSVSNKIIPKLFQYDKTLEKSENNNDAKLKNPEFETSWARSLKDGISDIADKIKVKEKIPSFL